MTELDSKMIIHYLAHGIHPFTSQKMPPDSLLRNERVVQAFRDAVQAMSSAGVAGAKASFPRGHLSWSKMELATLRARYACGETIQQLSVRLQRDPRAIKKRLEKLGETI